MAKARRLAQLGAIGETLAWVLATELFGWRAFQNRRQVGGFVGLTPTPFQSGGGPREQGITRNGSREWRALVIELAWLWLRYQPQSALSQWYQRTDSGASPRLRRIGIVALARQLLVALWRSVDFDELPAGARLKVAADAMAAAERRRSVGGRRRHRRYGSAIGYGGKRRRVMGEDANAGRAGPLNDRGLGSTAPGAPDSERGFRLPARSAMRVCRIGCPGWSR